MATNQVHAPTRTVRVGNPTLPTNPASGDAVCLGQIAGIALTDDATDGSVVIALDGVWLLAVEGEASGGGSAVSAGDRLYIDTDGVVNKDATNGVPLGYALSSADGVTTLTGELVASGATTTIRVLVSV